MFLLLFDRKPVPDPRPALPRISGVGEIQQSMTVVRQTIVLIITVRMSHRTSIERQASVCQSIRENKTPCTLTDMAVSDEFERTWEEEILAYCECPSRDLFPQVTEETPSPPQKKEIPNKCHVSRWKFELVIFRIK